MWANNIEAALIKADPDDAQDIKATAEACCVKLQTLDISIKAELVPVPADKCKVPTSHDALGYCGKDYGVSFLSPLGLPTEVSAADAVKLIDQIKAEGMNVRFLEKHNDSKLF